MIKMNEIKKGVLIPLAATCEFFNPKLHKVVQRGGNIWIQSTWKGLKDGEKWNFPESSGRGNVALIKREKLKAWEIA